ncbi:MAG: carbamoyltransferase [Acidobacteria bacterium]|nr:carbamoyltransferase [Acidobacteriota bacterium]
MSVVLGLHFGHDASVAVVIDGHLSTFLQRERLSRIKHAYSLDRQIVELALDRSGVTVNEIDAVAVTSTQGCEPILYNFKGFSLSYDASMRIGRPALLVESLGSDPEAVMRLCVPSMVKRVLGTPADPKAHPAFRNYLAEYGSIPYEQLRCFPWLDAHIEIPEWRDPHGLRNVSSINIDSCVADERKQLGFHYPLRVTFDGRSIAGVRVDHHLAHAASSYFRSGSQRAIILTNDGYGGRRTAFSNGGIYLGLENRLIAVAPHFLTHGHLYDYVARSIGLDPVGGPGKLMGLAPYGSPVYYDQRFVGDPYDHERFKIDGTAQGWIEFARNRSREFGHEENDPSGSSLPFSEFQVNLAASTQALFEESWLALTQLMNETVRRQNIRVDTLCLSGGAALNCPSNSRVCNEGGFSRVFIEPNCDDSGLSIGAALWIHHSLMDNELERTMSFGIAETYSKPYSRSEILSAAQTNREVIRMEECTDSSRSAAQDLSLGKVVAWFEGGSEMGPRALGHRSVLADPRPRLMHQLVNRMKGRELWRPFAPAVLQEDASGYFDFLRMPPDSPFMLLTTQVLDPSLAAITHVDGSARVQTVTVEGGRFYSVLAAFKDLTGLPVLLNTSMNGPGEPIVETPDQAIRFLTQSGVDVLYLEGLRITRR